MGTVVVTGVTAGAVATGAIHGGAAIATGTTRTAGGILEAFRHAYFGSQLVAQGVMHRRAISVAASRTAFTSGLVAFSKARSSWRLT